MSVHTKSPAPLAPDRGSAPSAPAGGGSLAAFASQQGNASFARRVGPPPIRPLVARAGDDTEVSPRRWGTADDAANPIADRAEFDKRMAVTPLAQADAIAGARFLTGLPIADMVTTLTALVRSKPAVLGALAGDPAGAGSPLSLALEAFAAKGKTSRLGFEDKHRAELAPLRSQDTKGVDKLLSIIGPEVPELVALKKTIGYGKLSDAEQSQISYIVAGDGDMSTAGAAAMRRLLANKKKNLSDPETFRAFIRATNHDAADIELTKGQHHAADGFELLPPTPVSGYGFHSGPANAMATVVRFESTGEEGADVQHEVTIHVPAKPPRSGFLPSVQETAHALAALPVPARHAIFSVDLNPRRNPDDAEWNKNPDYKKAGGGGDFTSFMTSGKDGIVDIYPEGGGKPDAGEMEAALMHESGHIVSKQAWGEQGDERWKPWLAAMAADTNAPSKYGRASADEDFAESWALFVQGRGTPHDDETRALIPNRYKLMVGLAHE